MIDFENAEDEKRYVSDIKDYLYGIDLHDKYDKHLLTYAMFEYLHEINEGEFGEMFLEEAFSEVNYDKTIGKQNANNN